MAAQARGQTAGGADGLDQGPQVGDQAVVPGDQLVQLTAGRRVLVLEARGPSRSRLHQRLHDLVVDGGQRVASSGEEPHDGREPVLDGIRARRPQHERLPRAGQAIEPPRLHPPSAQRPQLVRQMLFDEGNLRLHGEDGIAQAGVGAAVRRYTGENPGAALLIHESARAVDRVHQQAPAAIPLPRPTRQHEAIAGESLGHQAQRLLARELSEPLYEGFLTHPVDGVNRIASLSRIGRHGGEQLRGLAGACVEHRIPDALVQREDGLEQAPGVRHLSRPACSARPRPLAARPPSLPGRRRSGSSRRRSRARRGT